MATQKNADDGGAMFAGDNRAAVIADYKIAQFSRLQLPALMASPAMAGGLTPFIPIDWLLDLLKSIRTYADWVKECDKIKAKIQKALDTLQPPPQDHPLGLVVPPVPPTPGTTRLRQILEVIDAAKTAAGNMEPNSARDSLKEAKDMMHHNSVKAEFRRLNDVDGWYDILEELQDAIDYLERVSRH